VAAQVRPSVAAAVSNFTRIRQVAALSRANRGVSWAFLFLYGKVMALFHCSKIARIAQELFEYVTSTLYDNMTED